MKLVYTLIAITLALNSFSQTKKIAHKSHSGSMDSFSTLNDDSFGLPPMRIDSLIWYNDTTVIQVSSIGGNWHVQKDTLVNHPLFSDSSVSVDSLRNYYYRGDNATFIGFENKCPAPKSGVRKTTLDASGDEEMQNSSVDVYFPEKQDFADTVATDTLAKPKEYIKSRNEKNNNIIAPIDEGSGGITPFQVFVLGLFLSSILIFIALNKWNAKSSQMI